MLHFRGGIAFNDFLLCRFFVAVKPYFDGVAFLRIFCVKLS